jgi:hypothetical protein
MEVSCLEIEVFQQPHSKQEHLHDRQGYQPIAPAHERRHDDPQVGAEDRHHGAAHTHGPGADALFVDASSASGGGQSTGTIPSSLTSSSLTASTGSGGALPNSSTKRHQLDFPYRRAFRYSQSLFHQIQHLEFLFPRRWTPGSMLSGNP